mgnify:CR=1 FL=1
MRIGTGYDSHRFDAKRPLILGGLHILDHAGLAGHSDGDAIAHAVIDALLGAAAAGNVGSHFPPNEEKWKGADSMHLLARVIDILGDSGYVLVNIDVTVICESPMIAPYAGAMIERLARAMRTPVDRVSIKGKSNEGMGWIGSGEGIAVHAIALIEATEG